MQCRTVRETTRTGCGCCDVHPPRLACRHQLDRPQDRSGESEASVASRLFQWIIVSLDTTQETLYILTPPEEERASTSHCDAPVQATDAWQGAWERIQFIAVSVARSWGPADHARPASRRRLETISHPGRAA